jgi:hypothetical protein
MRYEAHEIRAQFMSEYGARQDHLDREVPLQGMTVPHVIVLDKIAYVLVGTFMDVEGLYGSYMRVSYTRINSKTGKVKYADD